jgi:hypothetical protein
MISIKDAKLKHKLQQSVHARLLKVVTDRRVARGQRERLFKILKSLVCNNLVSEDGLKVIKEGLNRVHHRDSLAIKSLIPRTTFQERP